MNGKQLAQHIGNIDEALVEGAREVPNYALRRRKTVLRRAVSLAAVLVLMLCSGAVGAVAFRQETEVRQETVELTEHPFFVGVQYHPEFKSRPNKAHPLFRGFIAASLAGQGENNL